MRDTPIHALLIEDDADDSFLLMGMMAQSEWPSFRFTLECAETLAAGLEILAKGEAEVVLLDLMLPDSQGLGTVRSVRARFPDVPVVVLTGMRDEALGLEAVLHGAQDYQVKGAIEAHSLKRTISYAVERHRAASQLKRIIDRSADGMAVVDAAGLVRSLNPAAEGLLSGLVKAPLGKKFPFALTPESTSELRLPSPVGERVAEMRVVAIDWEDQPACLASIRDITDLRRVEQLKAEVKESRRMDKLKDELMSAVSHEMRGPLTIIKAAAVNIMDGTSGPLSEDQDTMITLQHKNIVRLQKILDHILDLSRLESGKAEISPVRVDARQPVIDTAAGIRLVAADKGLEIDVQVPADLPPVYADPELLIQVLGNLLENAVRFARSNIVIRAEASTAGPEEPKSSGAGAGRSPAMAAGSKAVLFSVSDDGRGIPKDRLPELFNRFVQIDRGANGDGYKGTGLGLAICKEIVERQQGRIWAESDAGQGARFYFTLPQACSAAVRETGRRSA